MNTYLENPLILLGDVSYLAVFFCVIVGYVLGFIWYNPKTFGTTWMNELGLKQKDIEKGAMRAMLINLPITIAIAIFVAGWYTFIGISSVWYGVGLGLDLGVFVCLFLGMHYLYEGKSFRLFSITAGYNLVLLMTIGMIVGIFS